MGYFWKQNQHAEDLIVDLIEQTKQLILDEPGSKAKAIILLGTLSRGEGSWKETDSGLIIVSDLDLLIITSSSYEVPVELHDKIENLEKSSGIHIDLRFQSEFSLKLFARNTHLYDIWKTGIAIWGDKKALGIKDFKEGEIGFKDIIALFFNKCILSLEECSPEDFTSSQPNNLESLSRFATDTMFTCADFIAIDSSSYSPSVFERVNTATFHSSKVSSVIDEKQFTRDLEKAIRYKYVETDKTYLEDAVEFWLASRQHLMNIFAFLVMQEYGITDIADYADIAVNMNRSNGKVRSLLSRLRIVYSLLRTKRIPVPYSILKITSYCRMASLMLYLALGKDLDSSYIFKAGEFMSKAYFRRRMSQRTEDYWLELCRELKYFHKSSIL